MGVRERFINSIEYLRKLGFFEEYSNLSSEEIFEKISEGDILLKDLDKKEGRWAKKSDFEIDRYMATSDEKRVLGIDVERPLLYPGMCVELLNELASISRGVFIPTDVREDWPGELFEKRKKDLGEWCSNVYFTFGGKRHKIEFHFNYDFLEIGRLMEQVNSLIKDTGYQYYGIDSDSQVALLVVLTGEEADKLIEERGWRLLHSRGRRRIS
jgi:hypothetical protein